MFSTTTSTCALSVENARAACAKKGERLLREAATQAASEMPHETLVAAQSLITAMHGAETIRTPPPTSTLCLVMIVKDEEHVIERCLRSTMSIITSWSIVDTGSTDRTKEIIREVLKDIPGELHERPWKNFAHNRSEMIELARGKAAYNLMMDADDVLDVPEGFVLPELIHDKYDLIVKYENLTMPRPHIFKNDAGFRFESVLHEYLHKDGLCTSGLLEGITYRVIGGGTRGKDGVAKYKRDAEILREALARNPNDHNAPRYVFYLAQSYRDTATCLLAKDGTTEEKSRYAYEAKKFHEKALKAYEKRAAMGSYYEEVFVSLLEIGKLHEHLKSSERAIQDAYVRAYEALPARGAEPLYYLARYYRLKNRFALAYIYARTGATIPMPAGLFVDHDIYSWRIYDELALAAYYTGRFAESLSINQQLLDHGGIVESEAPRIEKNLQFCKERLKELECAAS
jgi:glycosyltransferase involved in cell wall biosynthesis